MKVVPGQPRRGGGKQYDTTISFQREPNNLLKSSFHLLLALPHYLLEERGRPLPADERALVPERLRRRRERRLLRHQRQVLLFVNAYTSHT